jgi:hypothetical protein
VAGDGASIYFKEDMLQMEYAARNRLLDVGWFPEGDLARGRYVMEIYLGDFHGIRTPPV